MKAQAGLTALRGGKKRKKKPPEVRAEDQNEGGRGGSRYARFQTISSEKGGEKGKKDGVTMEGRGKRLLFSLKK